MFLLKSGHYSLNTVLDMKAVKLFVLITIVIVT